MSRDRAKGLPELSTDGADGPTSTRAGHAAPRAFGNVAEALGEVKDLDPLLHLIAIRICELAGAQRCSVYLRDPETGLFRGQVGHPGSVPDARIKCLVAGIPADRFTREIVESKGPVVLTNALDDPRPIHSTMRAWNIRSILGVPMVLGGEVIGIVFLDNEDERRAFAPSVCELTSTLADLAAVAISQVRMTAELRTSVATVAKQNQLLRRAGAVDDRLASLVLEGGGVREIAEAVAELTGKPTAIHDAEHRRLALAVPPSFDEKVFPRLLELPYRSHRSVAAALASLRGARGGVIGPLPAAGLPQRFLVAPVNMREQEWGRLVIMEYGSRFGPLDMHIASQAAASIALELAAERRGAAAEWDARASLTADLIRGNRDAGSLERRARYLGVDPAASRVLCLVAADASTPAAVPTAAAISAALAGDGDARTVLAARVAEGVVALMELATDTSTLGAIAEARTRVEAALRGLGLEGVSAALSARCSALGHYVRAYSEARQVMTCLKTLSAEGGTRVLTADDLGPVRLVLATSKREEAGRFAHDALGALLEDDDGTRDLLATLRVFFDCGRSVRRSALAIGVHENTVRYRLARIEEMTGLGVGGSSQDQLSAQLALLVLRLEGAVPATATVREPAPT